MTMRENVISVLVVGQVPPPFGGQAIMIENLLRAHYDNIQLVHVPMRFSREMDEIGTLNVRKVFHLVYVVASILSQRRKHGCRVLYYPPAGHTKIAIVRDIAILLLVRPFFEKLVLHFHASGLSEHIHYLPAPLRWLASKAYGRPDCSIRLSELNPDDGHFFGSHQNIIIPNGIADVGPEYAGIDTSHTRTQTNRLLYMGLLGESKGVMVLLQACSQLKRQGVDFDLVLAGHPASERFSTTLNGFLDAHGMRECVHTPGVLTGKDKWAAFANADILCYPTFFESETFGLVVLEAMQCRLPVVATNWRGVPSLVRHNHTGLIVPTKDSDALADAIRTLISDPVLAKDMGRQGRQDYCDRYTLAHFHAAMEHMFLSLDTEQGG